MLSKTCTILLLSTFYYVKCAVELCLPTCYSSQCSLLVYPSAHREYYTNAHCSKLVNACISAASLIPDVFSANNKLLYTLSSYKFYIFDTSLICSCNYGCYSCLLSCTAFVSCMALF